MLIISPRSPPCRTISHNVLKERISPRPTPVSCTTVPATVVPAYVPKFQDKPNLCVASCLTAYIAATTTLRDPKEEYLWITFQKPHKVATKATLSRWVKNALEMAGVDTNIFKPHSSCHASTSAASRTGVSLDIIKDSAGWSKNSATFANFYNRPLVDRYQYSLNVLNS
nr:unnamed protein product [Callosobruchus analis]